MRKNLLKQKNLLKKVSAILLLALCGITGTTQATIVQFQTSIGDFEVNLFDKTTPETVANFLEYVEDGAYDDTIIHRSVRNFVVQGGGYTFDYDDQKTTRITTKPAVVNEPKLSNKRGTIAMAKLPNKPDSATSEWFFNMADNSGNLDSQNSGFTVFGQLSAEGLTILDAIRDFRHIGDLPVRNYSNQDIANNAPFEEDNLITIYSIVVLDASPDTADALNPAPTTRTTVTTGGKKKKSGGANELVFLLLLSTLLGLQALTRKTR